MSDLHPGDMNVGNEEENDIGGVVCDDADGDNENDYEGERYVDTDNAEGNYTTWRRT